MLLDWDLPLLYFLDSFSLGAKLHSCLRKLALSASTDKPYYAKLSVYVEEDSGRQAFRKVLQSQCSCPGFWCSNRPL